MIQGYTGHVAMWRNRSPFRQPFPETADAVFAGGAPPCIVVYVDAWTAYGGCQFVDSPGTGNYHTYLCDEVVAFVDARYRTIADRESRAITGKSSGGYGAMITPMLRPDVFGALATHAGDALYELCYVPEFGAVVRALRAYDGDPARWWADFTSRTAFTKPEDEVVLGIYGVAACFSAEADGTPVLPFDPVTGVLRPEVWAALAGPRPGPDGATARRCAALAARHLDRRRRLGRLLPGHRGPGVPGGAGRSAGIRGPGPLRAVPRHARRHRLPLPAVAAVARPAARPLTRSPHAVGESGCLH